jgi:hypothetical protein
MIPVPDPVPGRTLRRLLTNTLTLAAPISIPLLQLSQGRGIPVWLTLTLGLGVAAVIVVVNRMIVQLGVLLLEYSYEAQILTAKTLLKTHRIPLERICSLAVVSGRSLTRRSLLAARGYYDGSATVSGYGRVQVAASTLSCDGLLISYLPRYALTGRHAHLFITPEEPKVLRYLLEEDLAELKRRRELGQP